MDSISICLMLLAIMMIMLGMSDTFEKDDYED